MIDYDNLKKKAEAARDETLLGDDVTRKPWPSAGQLIKEDVMPSFAEFIAAASPDVVLELLRERDELARNNAGLVNALLEKDRNCSRRTTALAIAREALQFILADNVSCPHRAWAQKALLAIQKARAETIGGGLACRYDDPITDPTTERLERKRG